MPRIRFGHIFTFLMLLSFLSALVIPPAYSQRFKPNVQVLFVPVSWPAGALGKWAAGRFDRPGAMDEREATNIREQNAELIAMVSNLTVRLQREEAKSAQRESFPPKLRDRGVFVTVAGGDAGPRQTLLLSGPVPSDVANGMYAVSPSGLVGVVQGKTLAGGHVRLVTDVGFRVKCGFARLVRNADGRLQMVPIATPPVVVEGVGDNTLKVVKTSLTMENAAKAGLVDKSGKAVEGLWAFVDDRDVPEVLAGQPVGQVEKIVPRTDAPLFAEVTLHPATNLTRLREVLVVTKE